MTDSATVSAIKEVLRLTRERNLLVECLLESESCISGKDFPSAMSALNKGFEMANQIYSYSEKSTFSDFLESHSAKPARYKAPVKKVPDTQPIKPENHGKLLTMKEAAERFGCTVRTVQRWCSEGELQVVKRGRLVRVTEESLYALSRIQSK